MLIQRCRSITAMILREMTTRYGRSAGGYIWAIVEPVAYIGMFTLIFSHISREPSLGRSFPLFFATGVIAFLTYKDISESVGNTFSFNKPLFTYAQVNILDTAISRLILQLLTNIVTGTVVMFGLFITISDFPKLDFNPIFTAILIAAFFGFAVGSINSTIFVLVPTWQRLWGLLNRPLFLISGIFFTPESLPPAIREVILINPVVHIVGLMRRGFYPTYSADYINWPLILALPSILLLIGLLLMRKYQGQLIEQ